MRLHRLTTLALALIASGFAFAADLTAAQVSTNLDQALKKSDGNLLRSVLRAREIEGIQASALKKLLELVVKPVWNGNSQQMRPNGTLVPWASRECMMQIEFLRSGAYKLNIVEDRRLAFLGPTVKEGTGHKSLVSLSQIMSVFASLRANSPKLNRAQEARAALLRFEQWVPQVKKWGIKGSMDPETGRWQTWEQIIKEARSLYKEVFGKEKTLLNLIHCLDQEAGWGVMAGSTRMPLLRM